MWSWEASVQGTTLVWEALSLKPEALDPKLPGGGSCCPHQGMLLCLRGVGRVPQTDKDEVLGGQLLS